jgi:entericidin B
MKRTRVLSAALILAVAAAAGCANTVKGIGEDTANTVDATKEAGKDIAKAVE